MLEMVKNRTTEIVSLLEHTGYYLIDEQKKHEYKVFKKEDGSLLTELDIASDFMIKNELASLFGDIKVLSEENGEDENAEIAKNKFFFLLDPIDGTSYFDKGMSFTINLAFCIDRKPVLSFIHNPLKKTILFGDSKQAFKRTCGRDVKLARTKQFNEINKNCSVDNNFSNKQNTKTLRLAIGKHSSKNESFINKLIEAVKQKGYNFSRNNLSSLSAMDKLLSFVDNEIDGFLTAKCCKDWDILPALPILEAIKASYKTNYQLVYSNNNFDQGSFIVAKDNNLLLDLIDINNIATNNSCVK